MTTNNTSWQSLIDQEVKNSIQADISSVTVINSQSVLEISGPDSEKFLQGQCSADIANLKDGDAVAGCFCTVKGRVLSTFIATRIAERIFLRMGSELVGLLSEHLRKYAAFYKVELIEWPSPCVLEVKQHSLKTETIALTYNLNGKIFTEHLIEHENLESIAIELKQPHTTLVTEDSWQRDQITCGWLNLTKSTYEKYLPHQLNIDRLNAISFTKGCYTGQEIIARTEYRGKPKRRMHLIEVDVSNHENLNLPCDIQHKDTSKTLGILLAVSPIDNHALAILPIDSETHIASNIQGIQTNIKVPSQPYPKD